MIDVKEIFSTIRKMYESGKTQEELSQLLNVSRPYLCQLLNNKRPIGGLSIDTLNRLFPRCKLILDSDSAPVNQIISNNKNTGNITQSNGANIDSITDKILQLDIPAEAKIKVLQAIREK